MLMAVDVEMAECVGSGGTRRMKAANVQQFHEQVCAMRIQREAKPMAKSILQRAGNRAVFLLAAWWSTLHLMTIQFIFR